MEHNGSGLRDIYEYIRDNYTYFYRDKADLTTMACRMFNTGSGACWDYAAITYLMLDRAGYNCQIVVGKGYYASEHNWVIIEVEPGVWRHMDTERTGIEAYLVTDDVLDSWNMQWDGVRYEWNKSDYPSAK